MSWSVGKVKGKASTPPPPPPPSVTLEIGAIWTASAGDSNWPGKTGTPGTGLPKQLTAAAELSCSGQQLCGSGGVWGASSTYTAATDPATFDYATFDHRIPEAWECRKTGGKNLAILFAAPWGTMRGNNGAGSTPVTTFGSSYTKVVTATITSGAPTTLVAVGATVWASGDVGAIVTGTGIPALTRITAFTDSTHVTVSASVTAGTSVAVTAEHLSLNNARPQRSDFTAVGTAYEYALRRAALAGKPFTHAALWQEMRGWFMSSTRARGLYPTDPASGGYGTVPGSPDVMASGQWDIWAFADFFNKVAAVIRASSNSTVAATKLGGPYLVLRRQLDEYFSSATAKDGSSVRSSNTARGFGAHIDPKVLNALIVWGEFLAAGTVVADFGAVDMAFHQSTASGQVGPDMVPTVAYPVATPGTGQHPDSSVFFLDEDLVSKSGLWWQGHLPTDMPMWSIETYFGGWNNVTDLSLGITQATAGGFSCINLWCPPAAQTYPTSTIGIGNTIFDLTTGAANAVGTALSAQLGTPSGGSTFGPAAPPIVFSGADAALLAGGPTSAPAGAVTVTPGGTDISALTNANPAGTTFYLLAGNHTIPGGTFAQVIPKDGNTYIGAPGAVLNGANANRYAFTGSAINVTIAYLEITGFISPLDEFVVNHNTSSGWTVKYCNIHHNNAAGVGMGSNMLVNYCWLHHNQQYGFSSYVAPVNSAINNALSNATISNCEISFNGNRLDEWPDLTTPGDVGLGNGRNGGGKFWDTFGMYVLNNYVHDNKGVGIWADTNNVDFTCTGNWIEASDAPGIMYEISYGFNIAHNTLKNNHIYNGSRIGNNFPRGAIYISESGSDSAVGTMGAMSYIQNNDFIDNWDDVVLWESSDRFCNSPANTSGKIYKPKGHGASLQICNNDSAKVLAVTLTNGSPLVTSTAGVLELSDMGRAATINGTGLSAGAKLLEPVDSTTRDGVKSLTGPPYGVDAFHGELDRNFTGTTGSYTMTLAAGAISTTGINICRWKTQYVTVRNNRQSHNRANVLALAWTSGYTLPGGVITAKCAVMSQFGSYPTWSPYQGAFVGNNIKANQHNLWSNNAYVGPYSFLYGFGDNALSFSGWQGVGQDAGSTLT